MSSHRLLIPFAAAALLTAGARSQIAAYHDASSAGHQAQFNALSNAGYRMISLSIYGTTADLRYAAVWVHRAGPGFIGFHDLDAAQYQALIVANQANYAPTILTARGAGATARFAGVLEQTGYAAWARHGLTSQQLNDEVKLARGQGWRVITVDAYGTAADPRYIVAFAPNPARIGWGYYFANGVSGHQSLFGGMNQAYARPLTAAFNDDSSKFIALWDDTDVGQVISHHDMTSAEYQQLADQYRNQPGYYPINVCGSGSGSGRRFSAVWAATDVPRARLWSATGVPVPALAAYDTWMQSWMQAGAIRAAALAIVKDSRLVLARGYTWAEPGYPQTQPTSLFRIASCSKPLTSIAIHREIQKAPGAINYGSPMAGFFGNPAMADNRAYNINVMHLLTHQGGWDRDDQTGSGIDPMFYDVTIATALNRTLPITPNDIRLYMQGQPLDFAPGNEFQYSNYGYSLLGRILERRNPGKSYAQVIQQQIFDPLGITRPRVGRSHVGDRLAGEVLYHPRGLGVAQSVNSDPRPWVASHYGGWNQTNMDSHGAWVMAAPDFAKVLGAFDLGVQNPILSQTQATAMWTPPQGTTTWLKGWFRNAVPDGNGGWLDMREHNGILPGTRAYIGRRQDGLSFVLFTNGDATIGGDQGEALSNIANTITGWPTHDLFASVGLPPFKKIDDLMSPYGSPCPGSAGTPTLAGTGSAEIGGRLTLELRGALPGAPAFALFGATRTALDLRVLGAPGCILATDPALTVGAFTGRSGTASTPLSVPLDASLIGAHLRTQYAVVDSAANRLGLCTTNGLDIRVGGWLGQ